MQDSERLPVRHQGHTNRFGVLRSIDVTALHGVLAPAEPIQAPAPQRPAIVRREHTLAVNGRSPFSHELDHIPGRADHVQRPHPLRKQVLPRSCAMAR